MNDLVNVDTIQDWAHLFQWPIPVLHEKEVREFYYNLRLNDDGSVDSVMQCKRILFGRKGLGIILNVGTKGIR